MRHEPRVVVVVVVIIIVCCNVSFLEVFLNVPSMTNRERNRTIAWESERASNLTGYTVIIIHRWLPVKTPPTLTSYNTPAAVRYYTTTTTSTKTMRGKIMPLSTLNRVELIFSLLLVSHFVKFSSERVFLLDLRPSTSFCHLLLYCPLSIVKKNDFFFIFHLKESKNLV